MKWPIGNQPAAYSQFDSISNADLKTTSLDREISLGENQDPGGLHADPAEECDKFDYASCLYEDFLVDIDNIGFDQASETLYALLYALPPNPLSLAFKIEIMGSIARYYEINRPDRHISEEEWEFFFEQLKPFFSEIHGLEPLNAIPANIIAETAGSQADRWLRLAAGHIIEHFADCRKLTPFLQAKQIFSLRLRFEGISRLFSNAEHPLPFLIKKMFLFVMPKLSLGQLGIIHKEEFPTDRRFRELQFHEGKIFTCLLESGSFTKQIILCEAIDKTYHLKQEEKEIFLCRILDLMLKRNGDFLEYFKFLCFFIKMIPACLQESLLENYCPSLAYLLFRPLAFSLSSFEKMEQANTLSTLDDEELNGLIRQMEELFNFFIGKTDSMNNRERIFYTFLGLLFLNINKFTTSQLVQFIQACKRHRVEIKQKETLRLILATYRSLVTRSYREAAILNENIVDLYKDAVKPSPKWIKHSFGIVNEFLVHKVEQNYLLTKNFAHFFPGSSIVYILQMIKETESKTLFFHFLSVYKNEMFLYNLVRENCGLAMDLLVKIFALLLYKKRISLSESLALLREIRRTFDEEILPLDFFAITILKFANQQSYILHTDLIAIFKFIQKTKHKGKLLFNEFKKGDYKELLLGLLKKPFILDNYSNIALRADLSNEPFSEFNGFFSKTAAELGGLSGSEEEIILFNWLNALSNQTVYNPPSNWVKIKRNALRKIVLQNNFLSTYTDKFNSLTSALTLEITQKLAKNHPIRLSST